MTCQLIPAAKQRNLFLALIWSEANPNERLWREARGAPSRLPTRGADSPFAHFGRRAFVGLIDWYPHRSREGGEVLKPPMRRAEGVDEHQGMMAPISVCLENRRRRPMEK